MSAERMSWEATVSATQSDPSQRDLVRESYFDSAVTEAARRFAASEEWAATRQWLPAGPGRAVDVGAGRGIASYALAVEGWQVTAVEPDAGRVVGRECIRHLVRETGLEIRVMDGVAEAIPLANGSCDLLYARAVLHHTRVPVDACREVARVLVPGGRALFVREHVVDSPEQLEAFLAQHALHARYGGEGAFRLDEYVGAVQGAGLRLVRVLGPYDSPINFAPYSVRDAWGMCVAPIRRVLGWRLAQLTCGPDTRMGRWVMAARMGVLSRRDARPGRLFSFVAVRG